MPSKPIHVSKRRILSNVLIVLAAITIAIAGTLWLQLRQPAHATLLTSPPRPLQPLVATRAVTPDNIGDYRFRLSRTSCFGPCPVFSLEIGADGVARYEGPDRRQPVRGASESEPVFRRERQLSQSDRMELAKLVENGNFWSLKPSYDLEPFLDPRSGEMLMMDVTDLPSAVLTLWRGSEMKSVSQHIVPCLRNYPGSYSGNMLLAMPHPVPDVFCELTDAIERTSCAGYWGRIAAGDGGESPPSPDPRCEGSS